MKEKKIGSTSQRREGDVDSIVVGKPATVAQNIYIWADCDNTKLWRSEVRVLHLSWLVI